MRRLVDELRSAWQVSIRRACTALPFERSTYHYRSKRPDPTALKQRMREICETRVRYGYRRVHVLLRREGWEVNVKRVCRLYREMGLQLRNKSPKRKVKAKLREGRSDAAAPNQVWAMDFVHDQLFDGRKLRVLTIVDTFSRFSPAIEVRQSFKGADVVAVLERASQTSRLPEGHSARQRPGVRQQGSGPVGLHARRHARLQSARQANRQCVYRVPERQVPSRMPERQLVPEPRRGTPKMRGLA